MDLRGAAERQTLDDLELTRSRLGQLVGAGGALLSAGVALFVAPAMGTALLAMTLATAGFYTAVHTLLSGAAGPPKPWMRWASPVFEVVIPAAVLWIIARTEGPAYALGSWVPGQLFAVFLVASLLRLDVRIPIAMGVSSAIAYGLVWFFAIRPLIHDGELLHQPSMQLVRMGTLVLMGAAGSLGVIRIRDVVHDAGRAAREREVFGKYELRQDIGVGGMGRVVDALYAPEGGFRRRVAIKLLHPHLARDAAYVDRFRSEAEISARLAHPNVVAGLDFGRIGDTYFLAMEYVDGKSLAQILGERRRLDRPLDPRIVAVIGERIAAALEWAHGGARDDQHRLLRVVHRDLSPSNVLVDRAGRVRVTDFGVARALREQPTVVTGTLVGKPAYVAPEALRDQGIDPRSDLWSLGVILWEAVTNRRLFARDTDAAALLAVVEAEIVPPSLARPGVDLAWDLLIGELLVRDRTRRAASAAEVRATLQKLGGTAPLTDREIHELIAPEDALEELPLDETSDEVAKAPAMSVETVAPAPDRDWSSPAPAEAEQPVPMDPPASVVEGDRSPVSPEPVPTPAVEPVPTPDPVSTAELAPVPAPDPAAAADAPAEAVAPVTDVPVASPPMESLPATAAVEGRGDGLLPVLHDPRDDDDIELEPSIEGEDDDEGEVELPVPTSIPGDGAGDEEARPAPRSSSGRKPRKRRRAAQ